MIFLLCKQSKLSTIAAAFYESCLLSQVKPERKSATGRGIGKL
jgi:hypothetical protein